MSVLSRVHSRDLWPGSVLATVFVAVLMVAIVVVHTSHFADRNYREDEINTIHAAQVLSASDVTQWLLQGGVHPAGWRILATQWVSSFGVHESVTRYFATLGILLACAFVYRLGSDVFDRQVGIIAVLIFGALPYVQFFGHELRPYALLAASAAAMHVLFLRWLRRQTGVNALLYVLAGVIGLHTHYFVLYVVVAQMLMFVLLVRWSPSRYLRALGLFVALGVSFIPNAISILHGVLAVQSEGISYALGSDFQGLLLLNLELQGMLIFLLIGFFIPVHVVYPYLNRSDPYAQSGLFRFGVEWRRWYLIVPIVISFLAAFLSNTVLSNLTSRNMMIIMPGLAVLAAYEIRAFRARFRFAICVIFVLIGLFIFHPYASHIPYRAVRARIAESFQEGDLVVVDINHHGAAATAMTYYLLDRPPGNTFDKSNIFIAAEKGIDATFSFPPDSLKIHRDVDTTPDLLRAALEDVDRVFLIGYYGPPLYDNKQLSALLEHELEQYFQSARVGRWQVNMAESLEAGDAYYYLIEFHRKEANE